MEDILTLRESDYKNLFITCTHIDINNKENGEVSKPSKDIKTIITDNFDWEENFRKAYGND